MQPLHRAEGLKLEPCSNAWESLFQQFQLNEEAPQTRILSSSDHVDIPQGHFLPIGWNSPTWASIVANHLYSHHLYVHHLLNMIQNLDMKYDMNVWTHHLGFMV
jgi:hypothetical protein